MTVKRSVTALLVVAAFALVVARGFTANNGEVSTYLPLIQRALTLPNENLLLYSIYKPTMGVDFALATTPPSETFQLTFDGVNLQPDQRLLQHTSPFSPDGNYITFYKYPEPERTAQLWVMNSNGDFPKMLLEKETISNAVWGADNATLLYQDDRTLNAINIHTGASVLLAENVGDFQWDTTALRVYYTSDGQGLMRVNADGTGRTEIYDATPLGVNYIVGVLPDGRIVFAIGNIDENELYVMGADGTNRVRLTNDISGQQLPSISPDGSKLFYSLGSGKMRIVDMMGATVQEFTMPCENNETCRRGLYYSWSPDGTEVAFTWFYTENSSTEYALYRIAADGSQATPTLVSRGDNRLRSSAYSPDGRYFAYTGETEAKPEIYVLDRTNNTTELMVEDDTSLFVWSWRP
jgi:Tol biopolymer transport system component